MSPLTDFLEYLEPEYEEVTVWGGGRFPLRVVSYFCVEVPPLEFIMSVRAVVVSDSHVLVLRNYDETHIVPGGRREKGETLEETLRREILEETGWATDNYQMLGLWHFHHLTPDLTDFPYFYPDFLNILYAARPVEHLPNARLPDDYELECRFVSIEEVKILKLQQPSQLLFLQAALAKNKK
jgi:8-oxo-dGTP pyrophosphatase MutT (NUDIX family)